MKTPHECSRLAMRESALKAPGRIRLVAFDLDGTLTRGDTVCEVIGRQMGHFRRVRALEAICGKQRDRDSVRLLRTELVSYYRAATRAKLRSFLSSLTLAPGARKGFDLLRRSGVTTAIVSITWEFAAEWLAEKLGADPSCWHSAFGRRNNRSLLAGRQGRMARAPHVEARRLPARNCCRGRLVGRYGDVRRRRLRDQRRLGDATSSPRAPCPERQYLRHCSVPYGHTSPSG
jgi:hypothetical protein